MWDNLNLYLSLGIITQQTELVWLNLTAEGLQSLAYLMLLLTIIFLIRTRSDIINNWVSICGLVFLFAVSLSHGLAVSEVFLSFMTGWSKITQIIASFLSIPLIVGLWLKLPSLINTPTNDEFTSIKEALAKETIEHRQAGELIQTLNYHLLEQMRELANLDSQNQVLQAEIAAHQHIEDQWQLTQFAVEHAADAIFWLNAEGQLIYANLSACRSLGYSASELMGMTIHDINPKFPESAWSLHWNVLRRCGSLSVESYHKTKNNQLIPVELTISHLECNGQEYECAFVKDISDRKFVDRVLRQKQQEFQILVASIPGVVYRCSLQDHWNMDFLSEWIETITGYPASDFIHNRVRSFASIIHPEDRDRVNLELNLLDDFKKPYILEYRLIVKNGAIRWIYEKGRVILDENNHVNCLIGVMFDITDRKQAEESLRESEIRERERALQLEVTLEELKKAQTQLIQTEKMSSLGQMVAGIAHEINNPVSFIYGNITYANQYIQELLDLIAIYQLSYPLPTIEVKEKLEEIELDFLKEDLPKVIESMQMGADRIRGIVNSLRNFSRLDEAQMKPVDIHEGIENTLLILKPRLKANDKLPEIRVIKNYGNLPLIECYAGQLNQVFMNIINNAIDALREIPEDHPKLPKKPTISIYTEIKDKASLCVRIKDNGLGIPVDVAMRLFDPFFTTKPVGKGTGLGLSISYQIVQKHKGKICCNLDIKEGAEFIIDIPLHQT